ncbi:MAG: hypothetical protein IPM54_37690 [Polyangiaceae bacterium]|nr:hypothetical protein [Polyangiaceae bacterium]
MTDAKASRMVSDRLAITNTVVSSINIHGPEVAPVLEKLLFPDGVPPNLTVAGVLVALGAHLQARATALVNADRTHTTELADDDGYRRTRDENLVAVREFMSALRSGLAQNYGATVAAAYGLGGSIPEEPATVLTLAGHVEQFLRTRPLVETPKNKSLKIDPTLAADELQSLANALKTALSDVDREKREAQLTQAAKNDAMAAWGTSYSGVADAAAAFYVLGGRPELAERVRPTARRRAGLVEPEDAGQGTEAPPARNGT